MNRIAFKGFLILILCAGVWFFYTWHRITIVSAPDNDLVLSLKGSSIQYRLEQDPMRAIRKVRPGSGMLVLCSSYPEVPTHLTGEFFRIAQNRRIRLYVEFADTLPGLSITGTPFTAGLERGVVLAAGMSPTLPPLSLVGLNQCRIQPFPEPDSTLMVMAKVAGFDKAEYGTEGVPNHPLLCYHQGILYATSKLSHFASGRYGPTESWKEIWKYILSHISRRKRVELPEWVSFLSVSHKSIPLPYDARPQSIRRGTEWFFNGRFFVDSTWKPMWEKYQGDGLAPFGPPVPQEYPNGNGTLGILEGHASRIAWDGSEEYRYWIRNDVQGEVSMALAAAGKYLDNQKYREVSANLVDYIFSGILRGGPRNDPKDPNYGLLGWSLTHPWVYYQDDNARSLLGIIAASANLGTNQWDRQIAEGIIANFRTTGKFGFRGERIHEQDLSRLGLRAFQDRDLVNPHPHFESWIWATYLWLYDKTGYKPLLEKTREAIRLTMAAYPDGWSWTNGIQQERARMILPLAWLIRVDDTPEHREWLRLVAGKLLENQVFIGAIREELGKGSSPFDQTHSNAEYGLHEAPLIFRNGDPVADMLYTCNFAFFGLQEAWKATGEEQYHQASESLSGFLTRIQVKSDRWKDLDGAWFRAFDYGRMDYWASNADAGWGAWCTLTGWIQSWIVYTQILAETDSSFWDQTIDSGIGSPAVTVIKQMIK